MKMLTRRDFMAELVSVTAAVSLVQGSTASTSRSFKIAVISDEISQDFDHACFVISHDFGLHFVELRELWGKNLQSASEAEVAEARRLLAKYGLQVTDIASPLFKVDWPDAPRSTYSSALDTHGAAETSYKQQDDVLSRSISLARQFGTDKIRCFDFWRLEDVAPHRAAINEKLRSAAETVGKQGLLLVLENEFACNTATGREAAHTLAGVQSPHLALNWDPGNAVMRGELDAFSGGWQTLPKHRIRHCHCKNATKNVEGKIEWAPVDKGLINWSEQFRALRAAGYRDAISLETHWRGGGSPEASSRISYAGMQHCLEASSRAAGAETSSKG